MEQPRDRFKVCRRGVIVVGGLLAVIGCHRRAAPPPESVGSTEHRSSPEHGSRAAGVGPSLGSSVGQAGALSGEADPPAPGALQGHEGAGRIEESARAAAWGTATDFLVYVTLDVPGRLPPGAVLRVDLADASDVSQPPRPLASSELSVSHGDRLQVSIAAPTETLLRARRLALSARIEGRRGRDLLAITTVPLLLKPEQLNSRLELWVRALPSYERDPKFEPWLLSPEEMRRMNEATDRERGEERPLP